MENLSVQEVKKRFEQMYTVMDPSQRLQAMMAEK